MNRGAYFIPLREFLNIKISEPNKQSRSMLAMKFTESLGLYKVTYPIEKGEIVDWPSFEAIIDYAFYALRIDTSSCNLLYVTNPFLSIESRKRLASIFLEKYQVMGYYTVLSPILTMYSGGLVRLSSGYGRIKHSNCPNY